jgi:hypothetical protein
MLGWTLSIERTMFMNKALIDSYLRNLFGQVVGAILIVSQTSGIANPVEFTNGEWLLVANALWASLIPVILRWVNKTDPAFGVVAEVVVKEVSKKLSTAAASAKKKPAAKKAVAKKKPVTRKK